MTLVQTTDKNALVALLRALDSKQAEERDAAKRHVQTLPLDALLILSQMEAQHFRRHCCNNRMLACLIICAIYIPLFLYCWETQAVLGVLWVGGCVAMWMYVIRPNYYNGSIIFKPSRARQSIEEALADANDVSFLPVALTLLEDATAQITPDIVLLLRRLLPRLHTGDAQYWTPQQHQKLLALLTDYNQDTELRLCILKALEQIGDARAVPIVKALAALNSDTLIVVRRAAGECLPFLQERTLEQQQAQTLLRSSSAHHTDGTGLLRAASGTNANAPKEQLLRPR